MSTGRTMHITAAGSNLDDIDALNYPDRDIAEGVKGFILQGKGG